MEVDGIYGMVMASLSTHYTLPLHPLPLHPLLHYSTTTTALLHYCAHYAATPTTPNTTPTTLMWPTKLETGVQLAYGISGSGIVVPENGPRSVVPAVRFPRLRHHAPRYRRMGNSTVALDPGGNSESEALEPRTDIDPTTSTTPTTPQPAAAEFPHSGVSPGRSTDQFPEHIVRGLEAEAAPLTSSDIHDPTHGPLAAFFECGTGAFGQLVVIEGKRRALKSKATVVEVQAVAWGAGETLHVRLLMPVNKRVERGDDGADGSHDGAAETDNPPTPSKWKAVYPRHHAQLYLGERILQVEAWPRARAIAVRTAARITLVAYQWNNDPNAKGVRLERVHSLAPAAFVHMSVGFGRLAAVDANGTVTVWRAGSVAGAAPVHEGAVAVPEPHELSHWRRVCWARAHELLVASRSRVAHVQLDDPAAAATATTIVLARMWSRIQDLCVVPGTCHAFVLTTKEVMWCEIGAAPLRRLVSWKHYLDDSDALARMAVARDGAGYVCAVYSRQMPLVLVFSFAHVDGRACSARDPYFFAAPALAHAAVAPLPFSAPGDRLLNLVEYTAAGAVRYLVLRPGALRFRTAPGEPVGSTDATFPSGVSAPPVYFYPDEAHRLFAALASPSPLPREPRLFTAPGDVLLHYARTLSAGQNTLLQQPFPAWHTMAAVANAVPLFVANRANFDAMVAQLRTHYAALGLLVHNHIHTLFGARLRAAHHVRHPVDSAAALARALAKFSRARLNIRHATMLLATSLVRAAPADGIPRMAQPLHDARAAAPALLQAIFDDWDEPLAAPPPAKKRKRDLRHMAIAHSQASQTDAGAPATAPLEKTARSQLSPSKRSTRLSPSQPSQPSLPALSQPMSQPASSQPMSQSASSQLLQKTKVLLSQKSLLSQKGLQKKRKRKGGFA